MIYYQIFSLWMKMFCFFRKKKEAKLEKQAGSLRLRVKDLPKYLFLYLPFFLV
jgi:hypothetical protein